MKQTNKDKDTTMHESPCSQQKLATWKKVVFSAVVFCAFFVLIELLLALCGVKPILHTEDPYVGFSSYIPLFVEKTEPDGNTVMKTAENKESFFNPQQFPANKPAGTYRIFCLGGSTTYGRPYGEVTSFSSWLREMLPKADPRRRWEVINAGGISYASYRVAVLMEELNQYEPDMFIIYCGHNEFLERRTYGRIIEMPGAVRWLGTLMNRTRIHAALKRAVDTLTRRSGKTNSKRNLLPEEVKAILDDTVGPQTYHRDDQLQKQVLKHYRNNLMRMVDIAQAVGVKLIFVTPASNLRDSSPFKSEHRDGLSDAETKRWESLFDKAKEAFAAGQWGQALTALDEAARIDDRYAHLHYLRGRVLWQLQRYDQAKAAFIRARDEDICPLRALTPMRGIVTEVAKSRQVPLVDFAALVESRSEYNTPGENLFLDHVHPTVDGNCQLALTLLEAMSKQGIVHPADTWDDAAIADVKRIIEGRLDPEAHGIALRNLSRVLGWAGKVEEAHKLALRAIQMASNDAEAYFQAGLYAKELGDTDEGIKNYRKALQLNPYHYEAQYDLGIALQSKGKLEEAASHYRLTLRLKPDHAKAHNNLATVLLLQGNTDEAIGHFHKALQIDPDYADVYLNLGNTLIEQGKADEAVSHFRKALQIKADFAEAHHKLGRALARQGKTDEAINSFRRTLQLQPNYSRAHYNLGVALQSQGRLDEAINEFRQALKTEPDLAEACYNLGVAFQSLGKFDEAIGYFHKALEIRPNYARAHHNLGNTLAMTGRVDEALKYLREAIRLQPDWPLPLNDMAWILATHPDPKLRDETAAIELAERAAKLTRYSNPLVLNTLAAAYAAAGQFDKAVTTAQKALELASGTSDEALVNYIRKQLQLYSRQAKP